MQINDTSKIQAHAATVRHRCGLGLTASCTGELTITACVGW